MGPPECKHGLLPCCISFSRFFFVFLCAFVTFSAYLHPWTSDGSIFLSLQKDLELRYSAVCFSWTEVVKDVTCKVVIMQVKANFLFSARGT